MTIAIGGPNLTETDPEQPDPDERLKGIANLLRSGNAPPPITVRTLLRWFGAARRSYWVTESIDESLSIAGLRTIPYYQHTYLDGDIHFVLDGTQATTVIPTIENTRVSELDHNIALQTGESAIRISRLAAANNENLVSVKPTDTLAQAATKMLYHDYSQLPVMTTEREVKGIISWGSIGAHLATGGTAKVVSDVMEKHREILNDTSLFEAIPIIAEHQYVLVRGPDKRITGIVTGSDLSVQFRQLAEPFLLLGEIENYLRQLIRRSTFSIEEIAAARTPGDPTRQVTSSADLTFGEYIRLLQAESSWAKVQLGIDRVEFCSILEDVRIIRNGVMHFDPDGVEPSDLLKLRRVVTMFQRLDSMNSH